MREYWTNVYILGTIGFPYSSKEACEDAAFHV